MPLSDPGEIFEHPQPMLQPCVRKKSWQSILRQDFLFALFFVLQCHILQCITQGHTNQLIAGTVGFGR